MSFWIFLCELKVSVSQCPSAPATLPRCLNGRPPALMASPGCLRLHFQCAHGMLLIRTRQPFNELSHFPMMPSMRMKIKQSTLRTRGAVVAATAAGWWLLLAVGEQTKSVSGSVVSRVGRHKLFLVTLTAALQH